MDWDYSFFIPKNNAFSKQWLNQEDKEKTILIVTEVNRCLRCATCLEPVGEKGTAFYEMENKNYCMECGNKIVNAKSEKENRSKTQGEILAETG